MKKIFVMMIAIIGILFATSCSDDESNETTLTLSENAIEFDSNSNEKTISVITDDENWSAIGSDGWIKVSKNGSDLVVVVTMNKTTSPREGKILVVSGNANAIIEVTQLGEKAYAKVIPEDIVVDQFKGHIIVDIIANQKDWTVKTDADWLTLTPKPFKQELGIEYTENKERKDRVAKIELKVGATIQDILVKQSAILFFLAPYEDTKVKGASTIIDFEEARHSTLTGDNTYGDYHYIDFNTISPLFYELRYLLSIKDDSYREGIAWAKKDLFEKEFDGFKDFLVGKGYTFDEQTKTFTNTEKELNVIVSPDGDDKYMVTFKYVPAQKKDHKTFKKFPYGNIDWGATKKEIDVYEEKHKGKFDAEMSAIDDPNLNGYDYLYYKVQDDSYEKAIGRAYYVNHPDQSKPGHNETAQYFDNGNLAFYNLESDPLLTKEFKALCEKEGWKFKFKMGDGRYVFMDGSRDLAMTVRYAKYPEYDNPILDIHILEYKQNSNSTSFSFKEKAIALRDSSRR